MRLFVSLSSYSPCRTSKVSSTKCSKRFNKTKPAPQVNPPNSSPTKVTPKIVNPPPTRNGPKPFASTSPFHLNQRLENPLQNPLCPAKQRLKIGQERDRSLKICPRVWILTLTDPYITAVKDASIPSTNARESIRCPPRI